MEVSVMDSERIFTLPSRFTGNQEKFWKNTQIFTLNPKWSQITILLRFSVWNGRWTIFRANDSLKWRYPDKNIKIIPYIHIFTRNTIVN